MKRILLCLMITFTGTIVSAQEDSTSRFGISSTPRNGADSVVEELVRFAMNNPRIRSVMNAAEQWDWSYRRERTAYLNNLVVSGNLNEISIKGPNASVGGYFYPRYNIGMNIPLGLFINNKKTTAAAYHRYQSALDQVDVEKQSIRREVTLYFETWQSTKALMDLAEQMISDAESVYKQNEKLFLEAKVPIDIYSASARVYNAEQVKLVNLQFQLSQAETYLEELIGMKFQEAMRQISIRQSANR